jgi:hypothetical protein
LKVSRGQENTNNFKQKRPAASDALLPIADLPSNLTPTLVIPKEVIQIEDTDDEREEKEKEKEKHEGESLERFNIHPSRECDVKQEGYARVKEEDRGDLTASIANAGLIASTGALGDGKKGTYSYLIDEDERTFKDLEERRRRVMTEGNRLISLVREDNRGELRKGADKIWNLDPEWDTFI